MARDSKHPVRPHLVMMSYRGGDRLRRCLDSIAESADLFDRVILSITAPADSPDEVLAREDAQSRIPQAEVITTDRELPTMEQHMFWAGYL